MRSDPIWRPPAHPREPLPTPRRQSTKPSTHHSSPASGWPWSSARRWRSWERPRRGGWSKEKRRSQTSKSCRPAAERDLPLLRGQSVSTQPTETGAISATAMLVNRMDREQSQDAMSSRSHRGFGVEAALADDIVRELAPAAERAGYSTFWVNDEVDGDGLAALREAATVTTTIRLGVGAIPLDRQRPERIASRVKELALPVERLVLGVGSGHPAGGLERVRNGVAALRDSIDATLVVAAIGPRRLALAGEIADGVLLDWPAPSYVVDATEIVAHGAAEIQRPRPWIGGYVFTAVGSSGIAQLRREAERYAAIPSYAAHFARMGVGPMETVACGEDAAALQRSLGRYDAALDETVVRAVVAAEAATAREYLAVLLAAASG